MFSALSTSLSNIFSKIKNRGLLTESDVDNAMREIRIALLEADVAISVVKKFIQDVKEKAIGAKILKSIDPGQLVVKIVHDEIVELLGNSDNELNLKTPGVIMMVGLQGSGKTTSTAKLGLRLQQKHKKKVLLVSTDIYRPAAQLQLQNLAKQVNIDSLPIVSEQEPIDIVKRALNNSFNYDIIIVDTAGRLQTNNELMEELSSIKKITNPTEVLLVSDSMLGQDAVNIAQEFHTRLGITGIVLTRVDGDARGGAALSMKITTGCPIKFIGIGEKPNDFEDFHPDRAASRILGMGDVVSLVEKANEMINAEDAEKMAKKLQKGRFDMNDLLSQIKNIKKMGSITSLLSFIPGISKIKDKLSDHVNDSLIIKYEAIINSMTLMERSDPKVINGSRKRRIAKGSGTTVQDINTLIKQYLNASNIIKSLGKKNKESLKAMLYS